MVAKKGFLGIIRWREKREKSDKLFSVLSSLLLFGVSFGTVSLPILRGLPVDKKGVEEKGVERGLDQSVSEAVDSKKEEEGRAVEVKNGVEREGGGSEIVWLLLSRSPLSPPPLHLSRCLPEAGVIGEVWKDRPRKTSPPISL